MRSRLPSTKMAIHLVLIGFSIIFLIPLAWMISTALKPIEETMQTPPIWIPSKLLWSNFADALAYNADKLGYIPFLVYARNTLILCLLVVAGTVASKLAGRLRFRPAALAWSGRCLCDHLGHHDGAVSGGDGADLRPVSRAGVGGHIQAPVGPGLVR
ncbi:MAG TPA: hypothetical protein VM328_04090 [Fimbriimonadaceae bacterium]|nr:hypothetical protein [Fimbriimonadaceae bacterium]